MAAKFDLVEQCKVIANGTIEEFLDIDRSRHLGMRKCP